MKKICMIVLCLLLAVLPSLAFADAETAVPQPEATRITVTGSSSIVLAPDYVTLTLGVYTQAQTVTEAQAQNADQMNKLVTALHEEGIAREDMQTQHFGINPIYSDGGYRDFDTTDRYQVDNSISITVRDLSKISQVLDVAMRSGANQSYGLTFASTQRSAAYDTALTEALRDAERKATLLAEAQGKKLGPAISIVEGGGIYLEENTKSMAYDSGSGTPILSGTLVVSATVEGIYPVIQE